jgi:hypothetical protein
MEEIWKDIPGFEAYQASNLGRIKSCKYGKEKFIGFEETKKNNYKRIIVKLNGVGGNVGRFILITFDRLPNENEECDHINRDGTDNRIENLRWVTSSVNKLNRRNWGNCNLKGVSICTEKRKKNDGSITIVTRIRAQIKFNKKQIRLGDYKTKEEAHEAYKKAYLNYYGHEWMG